MATFILTWNPNLWTWDDDDYTAKIQSTAAGLRVTDRWSVGVRRGGIEVGDRAFLLRQHRDRGIVASGLCTSTVFLAPHWDGTGRDAPYVDVEWDTVVDPDARLPTDTLMAAIPAVHWNRMYGSGVEIPGEAATVLEQLWAVDASTYRSPEELAPTRDFVEGGVARVEVNRYERDPQAREGCLNHWGYRCSVCDLSMEELYGEIGRDFIHVHHLVELSTVGPTYHVDPVADLRPVCPNCHAMVHQHRPAFSIQELRQRMSAIR